MSTPAPCPGCGTTIAPCPAPIPELGPDQVCGSWGCALADHYLEGCPSPQGEDYRARVKRRGERNKGEQP